jgi:MSHA biogenesis protein MshE
MSGLDISERRLPQDGRFNIRVRGRSIDIRLSTMPLQYGESVVMRLLDQSGGLLSLEQIGMPEVMLQRFRNVIQRPHGLVLVTGPTGSGKTTTLYGALNTLNDASKKVITVEDPVEYRLPRINQVQVQSRIDLSFARVLRASLRQDPDIVMVGEMRDQETTQIGLRAAMTGHLVLSTLHTNDAVSTALRLLDMGAEGFVVGSSLLAILAQRLVRRICESCVEDDPLDAGQRSWLAAMVGPQALQQGFKRGAGCPRCHNTGYHGRIGVFELLQIDTPLADALRRSDSAAFTKLARQQPGFKGLSMAAYDYACQGITSMEEVLRVSGQIEEFDPVTGDLAGYELNEDGEDAAVSVPGT